MAANSNSGMFEGLGGLFSAALGKEKDLYVPEYKPVSVGEAQQSAVGSNLTNFADIESLTKRYNSLSADELIKSMEKVSPGIGKVLSGTTAKINELLSGTIPQDVQNAIQRSAASAAVSGGYGGSGLQRNLTTRDLGLTSLNLMQTGLGAAQGWTGTIGGFAGATQFNPTSLMVSPSMALQAAISNNENQWNRDWLAAQVAAQGTAMDRAWSNALTSGGRTLDAYAETIPSLAAMAG